MNNNEIIKACIIVINEALKCDLPLHRKILVYREALYKIKRILEGVK